MSSVAIVMPYYNEKEFLVKSVEAITKQTYKDWHLYLIDDGTPKGNTAFETLNLQPEHVAKTTIVWKPNGGVSSARNIALTLIAFEDCDYIAYCDSDDNWDSDHLEKQIECLNSKGHHELVYAGVRCRFPDGSIAVPFGISNYSEYPGLQTLLKGNFIYISGVLHSKHSISHKWFDGNLNGIEDWDMWCRIAEDGSRFIKGPETVTYVVKPGNTGNAAKSNSAIYESFYRKHSKYIDAAT